MNADREGAKKKPGINAPEIEIDQDPREEPEVRERPEDLQDEPEIDEGQ